MAGYTKGPWIAREYTSPVESWFVHGPDNENVTGQAGGKMTEANARLIAAAPDLLEAAREALAYCEHIKASMFGVEPSHAETLRVAIAKATGDA